MWDLSPSSLADQSAEGPGPREAVGYRTQQANASHSGAFPVGAAGQVGRKSPGPFGLIAKARAGTRMRLVSQTASRRNPTPGHVGAFLHRKTAHRFYGGRDDGLRSINLRSRSGPPIAEHKHMFRDATRIADEQLECSVPLRTEATVLWQSRL